MKCYELLKRFFKSPLLRRKRNLKFNDILVFKLELRLWRKSLLLSGYLKDFHFNFFFLFELTKAYSKVGRTCKDLEGHGLEAFLELGRLTLHSTFLTRLKAWWMESSFSWRRKTCSFSVLLLSPLLDLDPLVETCFEWNKTYPALLQPAVFAVQVQLPLQLGRNNLLGRRALSGVELESLLLLRRYFVRRQPPLHPSTAHRVELFLWRLSRVYLAQRPSNFLLLAFLFLHRCRTYPVFGRL